MWKPFIDSGNLYMLRLEQGESELTLLLTNFLFIWESQFSAETLVHNFKENNPLITATDCQIKTDVVKIVNNLQNIKTSVKIIDDGLLELILEQSCDELSEYLKSQSILYKFSLHKKSQNEFKNKVTVSAIQTIYFLEQQQKTLLNLVQKKDRELEEYRMEKGDISRGDLKTEKFNFESVTSDNDQLFLNIFSNENGKDFWKKFTEENGEIQTTRFSVEAEPWNARPRKRVIHSSKNVVKKGSGVIYRK